jgi:hypothetical protein
MTLQGRNSFSRECQREILAGGKRSLPRFRPGGAERIGVAHPRRGRLLPGCPRRTDQAHRGRPEASRAARSRDPPNRPKALVSDEIVDIFAAAGLKKPDISILSDEFLAEIRGMPQRNLAVELPRKLLVGEIKTRSQRNVVQARSFTELLERSVADTRTAQSRPRR